ncbi:MAG TPA: hypothetical protein VGT44_03275 [Ktedonobacteraceae bacterium]|nr:hypothetical protein [Ktedonobacteraceae bacterium]
MRQPAGDTYIFDVSRKQYLRITLLAWLLIAASLTVAVVTAVLGVLFWPTYVHTFTFYLKWQDALLATLWYCSFILVSGSILTARFLFALRAGQREGVFLLRKHDIALRDLSPKNLASIYWLVGTALSCFLAALVGLGPAMLIGWTLHLASPILAIGCTIAAVVLSLAGLIVTLVSGSFILIGIAGSSSFSRNMGALHTYALTSQATIRVDGLALTAIYPDQPETLFDLDLLEPEDRQRLLHLLRKRWLGAERPWTFRAGDEFESVLEEARLAAMG